MNKMTLSGLLIDAADELEKHNNEYHHRTNESFINDLRTYATRCRVEAILTAGRIQTVEDADALLEPLGWVYCEDGAREKIAQVILDAVLKERAAYSDEINS